MHKKIGMEYEKYIGTQFEIKKHFVIYNGIINGLHDKGVDIIVLSSQHNVINLIQCKNWNQKKLNLSEIEKIHHKLINFRLNFITFLSDEVLNHLTIKRDISEIEAVLKYIKEYYNMFTIKYKLYIASDKVIDLEVGKHVKLIKNNKFLFKNMEIIFRECKQTE